MSREELIGALSRKLDSGNSEEDITMYKEAIYYIDSCDKILKYVKGCVLKSRQEMDFEKVNVTRSIEEKVKSILKEEN